MKGGKLMKRMIVCSKMLVFITCILIAGESLAQTPDRISCVIHDDFETGEMYGWEAYPYAQDIGYEPFTIPQKEPTHNNSRYALTKIHRPNDIVEVYVGFTKQIDLWTTLDTRMKVALFLTSDRKPDYLEFSICLQDGRRYFHYIHSPAVNRWLEVDIPLDKFTLDGKLPESGQHIQAVTIMAMYSAVSHLPSYNITMDDFFLNGERQRRFITLDPQSTTFEMYGYSILNKHFYYGDSLGITVKPEDEPGKGTVRNVTCSLADPSGKKVVSGVKLSERDGAWSVRNAYTFKKKDSRGQWTINFHGVDSSGGEIEWGFRFLMPGVRLTSGDHPRLFLQRKNLRKNSRDNLTGNRRCLIIFLQILTILKLSI